MLGDEYFCPQVLLWRNDMKKISIICGGIIIAFVLLFLGYRYWMSVTPDDGSVLQEQMQYLNEEIDLQVLLYGEDVVFPEEFTYKSLERLDEDNWKLDNDYVFLIVNDLDGSVGLAEEQITEIKEYADQNTNFNFYYIGLNKLELFKKVYDDCNIGKTDMSFGYVIYEGTRLQHYGLWRTTDHEYYEVNPKLLGQDICDTIEQNVRSNE